MDASFKTGRFDGPVAIVDDKKIDEINIHRVTIMAMRMSTTSLLIQPKSKLLRPEASASQKGYYVVCG